MPWYSINTASMIQYLRLTDSDVKQVWLADDAAAGCEINSLHRWYNNLKIEGEKYGYFVNGGKSWLIVKSDDLAQKAKSIFGKSVNITVDGKRHLGSVIGSQSYKDQYCSDKVENWKKELVTLCEIAKSQPQAAYVAFTKGYRSKFTYFLRTIPGFEQYLAPVDDIINESFLPTLFGLDVPIEESYKQLFTLAPSDGGLGIPSLLEEAQHQFTNSVKISQHHTNLTLEQSMILDDLTAHTEQKNICKQENKKR